MGNLICKKKQKNSHNHKPPIVIAQEQSMNLFNQEEQIKNNINQTNKQNSHNNKSPIVIAQEQSMNLFNQEEQIKNNINQTNIMTCKIISDQLITNLNNELTETTDMLSKANYTTLKLDYLMGQCFNILDVNIKQFKNCKSYLTQKNCVDNIIEKLQTYQTAMNKLFESNSILANVDITILEKFNQLSNIWADKSISMLLQRNEPLQQQLTNLQKYHQSINKLHSKSYKINQIEEMLKNSAIDILVAEISSNKQSIKTFIQSQYKLFMNREKTIQEDLDQLHKLESLIKNDKSFKDCNINIISSSTDKKINFHSLLSNQMHLMKQLLVYSLLPHMQKYLQQFLLELNTQVNNQIRCCNTIIFNALELINIENDVSTQSDKVNNLIQTPLNEKISPLIVQNDNEIQINKKILSDCDKQYKTIRSLIGEYWQKKKTIKDQAFLFNIIEKIYSFIDTYEDKIKSKQKNYLRDFLKNEESLEDNYDNKTFSCQKLEVNINNNLLGTISAADVEKIYNNLEGGEKSTFKGWIVDQVIPIARNEYGYQGIKLVKNNEFKSMKIEEKNNQLSDDSNSSKIYKIKFHSAKRILLSLNGNKTFSFVGFVNKHN